MDFCERLLRSELHHLSDNVQTLTEELMLIEDFVKYEFASRFNTFIKLRQEGSDRACKPSSFVPSSSAFNKATPLTRGIPSGSKPLQDKNMEIGSIAKPQHSRIPDPETKCRKRSKNRRSPRHSRIPVGTLELDSFKEAERDHHGDLLDHESEFDVGEEMFEIPYEEDGNLDSGHTSVVVVLNDEDTAEEQNSRNDEDSPGISDIEKTIGESDEDSSSGSDVSLKKNQKQKVARRLLVNHEPHSSKHNTAKSEINDAYNSSDDENRELLRVDDSDPAFNLSELIIVKGDKKPIRKKKLKETVKLPLKSKSRLKTDGIRNNTIDSKILLRQCPVCIKKIKRQDFRTHVTQHTEEETDDKQICRVCCRIYLYRTSFLRHMASPCTNWDRDAIYKCSYCDFLYPNNYRRIEHERSHTGEKPYSCELCELSFSRNYLLTQHTKNKHTPK